MLAVENGTSEVSALSMRERSIFTGGGATDSSWES
jgi:hypothetical protein